MSKINSFVVNGTTYRALPFTFNLIVDLEDMGLSLADIQKKPMSVVRAYFALCAGKDKDFAGEELQAHILSGGNMEDVFNAMAKEMEDSDFFRNLNKSKESEVAENQKEKKSK